MDIDILYQDEAIVAINKPAGLPTLPDGYHPEAPYVASALAPSFGRLWFVHRLDRETSGVLVLARSAPAHQALNTQFEQHQTVKVYHALVVGSPDWNEKIINLALRPNGDRRHRTVVDPQDGKPAITQCKVVERFHGFTLIEAIPATGRTHQIRAHLAASGFNIAADRLYGGGLRLSMAEIKAGEKWYGEQEEQAAPPYPLERVGLHARSLKVRHPITEEFLRIEAPYPTDLTQTLDLLRLNN